MFLNPQGRMKRMVSREREREREREKGAPAFAALFGSLSRLEEFKEERPRRVHF